MASGGSAAEMFDLMLGYATSQDGALHAEKYYRTAAEVFDVSASRPSATDT